MCDKNVYREAGYEPRQAKTPLEEDLLNPKDKKKIKPIEREHTGIEFLEDYMR